MKSLWIFAFLFLLGPARSGAAEVINSSVGQVGEHVITAREVWISNFFERWSLARRSTDPSLRVPKPDWKPVLSSDVFNQAASSYMLEYMVALEAENFSISQATPEEIRNEAQDFAKSVSASPEWKKLEVQDSELNQFVERKFRARHFLKFKTESSGVVVSDDEAKTYFERNRLKFGNHPFSQFKDSIKEVLSRKALEERLKDWFEVLRRKYRVRFLGPPET